MERLLDNGEKIFAAVGLLIITCMVGWFVLKNYSKEFMPVRYVRVSGIFEHLGKEEIKQTIEPLTMNDFISVDIQAIHEAALSLPWVAQARVKRVWPDVIDIMITEQKAAFRWGNGGLLNMQGNLFKPQDIIEFSTLALISGPLGHEQRLFNVMQDLISELGAQSLFIKEFSVNERRSWKIVLESGAQIQLGRREPAKNFRRFVQTLPVLGQDRIEVIEKVDLRYPNGYAVTWKDGVESGWKQAKKRIQNT